MRGQLGTDTILKLLLWAAIIIIFAALSYKYVFSGAPNVTDAAAGLLP